MARPPQKNFSDEYLWATSMANPHWRFVRLLTLAVTLHRDVIFPWFRASDCDHLHYRNLGREWPLIDLVPLHRLTHIVVGALRTWGFSIPINFLLRAAYMGWLIGWIIVFAEVLHLAGVIAWNPFAEAVHIVQNAHVVIAGLIKHGVLRPWGRL
jgi:hypothetical protein